MLSSFRAEYMLVVLISRLFVTHNLSIRMSSFAGTSRLSFGQQTLDDEIAYFTMR